LIDELTNEIYRRGIMQASEWADEGRNIRTAINFSVNSFSKPDFCDFLVNTAAKYNVSPKHILLEITETQAMMIPIDCLEALMGMRLKRFGLSIDDFGTGNSSLEQLKNIPLAN
jgi:EAL domain-containing protein (putative c-di-GMP-specific phosphodiesterase class I)